MKIHLIISSYQPNKKASDLLRCALDTLIHFNSNYKTWVFDVGSPNHKNRVRDLEYPSVNFIYIKQTPIDRKYIKSWKYNLRNFLPKNFLRNGSFINGWTLDYGINYINDQKIKIDYFMTLQMDIMVCKKNWINDLLDNFDKHTIAVGVREQKNFDKNETILHSLGCLWDFKKFKLIKESFEPEFPKFDVGEKAISVSISKGFTIKSLDNTYSYNYDWDPLKDLKIDKSFNNQRKLVFVHLGRGIDKSNNNDIKISDWINLKNRILNKWSQLEENI